VTACDASAVRRMLGWRRRVQFCSSAHISRSNLQSYASHSVPFHWHVFEQRDPSIN
jgi:hypothetical protein